MKSINCTLLLLAIFAGFAASFFAGRGSVDTRAVAAPAPSPDPRQAVAEKILDVLIQLNVDEHKAAERYAVEERVEVVVAKKELPVGTILEEKDFDTYLAMMKFPKSGLPPDVIVDAEELKGKKLTRTLRQGNYFSAADVTADVGIKLPEGKYKYAIRQDGTIETNFLAPGDHVDILSTKTLGDGKTQSSIVLKNLLIVAIDTPSSRGREINPLKFVVCVAVTPEESLILSSAEKQGAVKVLPRDPKSN